MFEETLLSVSKHPRSMTPKTICTDFPEMTDEDYQEVVDRWLSIDSKDLSDKVYEADILPRSCYRMRLQANQSPVDLLLVPVGTQPYAPLMCCLGNPARQTVLLITEESRDCARIVEELFAESRTFLRVLIRANDSGDVVRKVMSVFDTLGQPRDVVCDVTGGTKIMTASLAGIAAMNGWSQVYVDSKFIRNKGSYGENLLTVASVFEHLGGWHTAHAWKLASVGQFGEAAKSLKLALDESVASGKMKLDFRRFLLAQAYREADEATVCRQVRQIAKAHGVTFAPSTLDVLESGDRRGLFLEMARTLAAEGQRLAASAVLAKIGLVVSTGELKRELARLSKEMRQQWNLDAWKPVDKFLGRPYSQEAGLRA